MSRAAAVFPTRTEAEVARARLEAAGIGASVVSDSAGGMEPQLEAIRGVRVIVSDDDLGIAIEILGDERHVPVETPLRALPEWVYGVATGVVLALVVAGLLLAVFELL